MPRNETAALSRNRQLSPAAARVATGQATVCLPCPALEQEAAGVHLVHLRGWAPGPDTPSSTSLHLL